MARLTVTARVLPDGDAFVVTGRDGWALIELFRQGRAAALRSTIPAQGGAPMCMPCGMSMGSSSRPSMSRTKAHFPAIMHAIY